MLPEGIFEHQYFYPGDGSNDQKKTVSTIAQFLELDMERLVAVHEG